MTTLSYPGNGEIDNKFPDTLHIHNGKECPFCHRTMLPRILPNGEKICGLCDATLPTKREPAKRNGH